MRAFFHGVGTLQQAGSPLLAEPVAIATDGNDVAVVEEAVEDSGCHHGIAEYRSPLADRAIAGDQHAAALVASRDELKEQMRGIGLKRQMPSSSMISSLGLPK